MQKSVRVGVTATVLAHCLRAETLNRTRFSKKSSSRAGWSLRTALLLGRTKGSQARSLGPSSSRVSRLALSLRFSASLRIMLAQSIFNSRLRQPSTLKRLPSCLNQQILPSENSLLTTSSNTCNRRSRGTQRRLHVSKFYASTTTSRREAFSSSVWTWRTVASTLIPRVSLSTHRSFTGTVWRQRSKRDLCHITWTIRKI